MTLEELLAGPSSCEHQTTRPLCTLCGEEFCTECDQYHRDACADARKP